MAALAARAKSLFLAASDLADPAERAAYLDRECGGDAELRARVEALLRANDAAPPPGAPGATVDSGHGRAGTGGHGDPAARVGALLAGRYRLVEEIGEGGMGSVFLARQTEPVTRAVAVKVIKAGMDSRAVLARFEAERQALAMMDHPNIARVLDAGATDGGRPFFVMELVKGLPITKYCDEHRLTPRQRLELFIPVCQAIQHAHQKGVIHRDVKPSNVLVALYDDKPLPKVIDFGVAKAAGQALTDRTLLTGFGALVGTPEYMSPEQASLNNLDIDTRSDVYSLGVLLYELLTGTTPVDRTGLGKAALLEVLRIVREVEAPRPSTRLSSCEALPTLSANRGMEPKRLTALVKGEIDWIVMKALEKDRSRRYETPNSFAADVQRYLAAEPVQAVPPSAGYRLRKFARRHRGPLTAAAIVFLVLLGGIVGTSVGLTRAAQERNYGAQLRDALSRANTQEAEAHRQRLKAEAAQAEADRQRALVGRLLYFSDVQLAQRAWEAGEHGRMRQLLDGQGRGPGGQPDLPGFEWHYLRRQCRLLHTFEGHRSFVRAVSWSPNGKRLASASDDKTVRLWDVERGRLGGQKPALTLQGHKDTVWGASWSPDGRRLATASTDGTVRVWDTNTGKEILLLKQNVGMLCAVSWAPDGKRLASGSGPEIWVRDAQSGMETLHLKQTGSVIDLSWSHDGKRVASAGGDGVLKVWDSETGKALLTRRENTGNIYRVRWSPDDRVLAIAPGGALGQAGEVQIWEAASGKEVFRLKGHTDVVLGVCFSPDGKQLASASHDRTVRVWDVESGKEALVLKGHGAGVSAVSWSSDGKRLASASGDHFTRARPGEVCVWDATTAHESLVLNGHTKDVWGLSWSADGRRLASSSLDGTLKIWDTAAAREALTLRGHSGGVWGVCFSPDSKRVASASNDKTVRVWDAARGKTILVLEQRNLVLGVSWSPDGKRLAGACRGQTVPVWDADSGKTILTLTGHTNGVWRVSWSPDGRRLASSAWDQTVRLWDADAGQLARTLAGHKGVVNGLSWSPDGRRLATASADNTLRVWDTDSGKEILQLLGHTGEVWGVSWSPDGKRLASASWDQTVRVWDTVTGKEALVLKGHTAHLSGVAWSPDGRRLASGSADMTVRLWDATPLTDPSGH